MEDGSAVLLQPCQQSLEGDQIFARRAKFICGILILLVVVLLWVFSSVITQSLYDEPDVDYDKPTALTTISCGSAVIFLLLWCVKGSFSGSSRNRQRPQVSWQLVLFISTLWFLCQWTFNLSLQNTALSTNAILSSTSTFWSYMFGLACGRARVVPLGVLATVCGMAGVALAVSDSGRQIDPNAPVDNIRGEVLAVGSAIAYGFFSNVLAVKVPEQDLTYVWGFVGFWSLLIGTVLMLVGDMTGLETFEVPSWKAMSMMTMNAVIGTSLSDYLWATGVLLTSPLIATVSLNLTIPVSFITDAVILHQHAFSWTAPAGALAVFLGVLSSAIAEAKARSEILTGDLDANQT